MVDIDYNITGADRVASSNMKVARSFMALGRIGKNAKNLTGDIKDLGKSLAIFKGAEMLISKVSRVYATENALSTFALATPTFKTAALRIGVILKKIMPYIIRGGVLAGAVLLGAMTNELTRKWVTEKLLAVSEWTGNTVSTAFKFYSGAFDTLRKKFANMSTDAFGTGAYFAGSQLNVAEAQKQLTPQQQIDYLKSESDRLIKEGYPNLVNRLKKEMKELFKTINDANDAKFNAIADTMRYEGRL